MQHPTLTIFGLLASLSLITATPIENTSSDIRRRDTIRVRASRDPPVPLFSTSDSPKTNVPQQPTCTGTDFPAPWKSMNEYCTMEFGVTCGIVLTFSASSGSGNPGNCGNACSCSECPADEIECNAQECNAHPAYVGEAPADSKFGTCTWGSINGCPCKLATLESWGPPPDTLHMGPAPGT